MENTRRSFIKQSAGIVSATGILGLTAMPVEAAYQRNIVVSHFGGGDEHVKYEVDFHDARIDLSGNDDHEPQDGTVALDDHSCRIWGTVANGGHDEFSVVSTSGSCCGPEIQRIWAKSPGTNEGMRISIGNDRGSAQKKDFKFTASGQPWNKWTYSKFTTINGAGNRTLHEAAAPTTKEFRGRFTHIEEFVPRGGEMEAVNTARI
ncbi:hypothetical protein V5735_19535 [Haladaptatus sp. SPP-AMP-3]|uniref:hypothetical protein n=1 Tax=Haladaptatus sp. SPP-AMP-3 TaxID=3121295 RepID=UPI003C2CB034